MTAALALFAFAIGRLEILFAVLFLFALQATFSVRPSTASSPKCCRSRDLSRANGVLEMSTFVAIVIGTAIGTYLLILWQAELWITAWPY